MTNQPPDWADKIAADELSCIGYYTNTSGMRCKDLDAPAKDHDRHCFGRKREIFANALREADQRGYRRGVEEAACPLHDSAALAEFVVEMRGIRGEVCKTCGGWGVYNYPSTATWRGGIGGQMFTTDVCNKCWGSGDETHPWPNRRALLPAETEEQK